MDNPHKRSRVRKEKKGRKVKRVKKGKKEVDKGEEM